MGAEVRVVASVPVAANFAPGTGSPSSPIIINDSTGAAYYLKTGDVVTQVTGGSSGVTSVAQSFTGGLISVAGSPITTTGTLALTVAGTSGGIPYFASGTTWASSGALTAGAFVVGGGAGAPPTVLVPGSGVSTWIGTPSAANLRTAVTGTTGTAGNLVFSGSPTLTTPDIGTPSAGVLTNCTGLVESGLTLANNTTNNVSTTKHGFTPILPNDATKYLDGTGAYTVPASGGGGGLVKIGATQTASASATLDFTSASYASGFDGTYNEVLFVLTNVIPATDAVDLWIRVSQDGGSTFLAASYAYVSDFQGDATALTSSSSSSAAQVVAAKVVSSSSTVGGVSGEFHYFGMSGTTAKKRTNWHVGYADNAIDTTRMDWGSGEYFGNNSAVNGVRFLFSAGNITSGSITMFGVQK